ncbi:hypothetical protein [Chromobacterium violaceum]|uniref:hypothetical protein n=1 Tax=Chromobacterium violaceum TaxID=536 RepID=UPI0012D2D2DB|nr:hypothetical protein [Chromobacterium violaceum]
MSVESQVANLVSTTNELINTFNKKKGEIDTAVSRAIAAAPLLERTWYIDQLKGDDKNGLGTEASPFVSIERAIEATPTGGTAQIQLLSDYTVSYHIRTSGRNLAIRANGGKKRLKLAQFFNDVDQSARMGGFWFYGNSTVELYDLVIQLPDGSNPPGRISSYYAMFFVSGGAGQPCISVRLSGCQWDLPLSGKFVGNIFNSWAACIIFTLSNTEMPNSLAGRIISGASAGINPATLSNVLTNLNSL